MKMHRFEEIWLIFAVVIIIGSMVVTGYQAFALGMGPPSHKETIDPQNVDNEAPFDDPGVFKVGVNEYDVVLPLEFLSFNPCDIIVSVRSLVNYIMTSKYLNPVQQII